jgi:Glyoxalase-like domain
VIDHIVYGVPRRLEQAVAWFAGLTGAQPARGGSHEGMGTTNFLIGLGAGAYLEIIGPDPDQPQPVGGRWFGIDRLTAPRIVTWAIRTDRCDRRTQRTRHTGLIKRDLELSPARLAWQATHPSVRAARPRRLLALGVMGSFLSLVVCCRFGPSALSNVCILSRRGPGYNARSRGNVHR